MLDYKGKMIPRERRDPILMSDVRVDSTLQPDARLSLVEEEWIDKTFANSRDGEEVEMTPKHMRVPPECDEVAGILSEINPNLVERVRRMQERAEIGIFASAMGSLKPHDGPLILEEKPKEDYWSIDGDQVSNDGIHRVKKWVRHHLRPRKTLFIPTGTKDGPNTSWVRDDRTTQILKKG